MAVALPGYVDTTVTRSVTVGMAFDFRTSHFWRPGTYVDTHVGDHVFFQEWDLYNRDDAHFSAPPPGPPAPWYNGTYKAALSNSVAPVPGGTPDLVVDTFSFGPVAPFAGASQPAHTFSGSGSDTASGFRLGVVVQPGDSTPWFPEFWTHFQAVYSWWADESTVRTSTMAGVSINFWAQPAPAPLWDYVGAHPGMTPRAAGAIGGLRFGCAVVAGDGVGDASVVALSGLVTDGWTVDTSELPATGILSRTGGGSTHNTAPGSETPGCSAPFRYSYDVDITKFGAGTTGARIFDRFENVIQLHSDHTQKTPQSDYLTCPVTNTYEVPITSWETHKKEQPQFLAFDITPAWAATQDPPLRSDDLQVPIWINPPLISPAGGGGVYHPVTANLAASKSVEFPDGVRRSHWAINNGAYGSVTESGGSTLFHVTDNRAVFTRTFVESWRTWTTTPFPRGVDAYEWTKHDSAVDDVWCWDPWAWLQVPNTAPAAGTATLLVDGIQLEVNDPHTTGSDRATSYSQTEHAFSFGYSLPLVNGSSSPFIDLLYPASGGPGPVYPSRVDKLTLSGLPVGDTTVTDLLLTAREQGYLKNDYGPPVQREDYSCLHSSQDGAFQWGNWPDEAYKVDETGPHPPYGGALRYVDPLTGSVSGDIEDQQYDLASMVGHWNRMEGWAITYSSAASDAALKDSFGTAIGTEWASWLRPIAPHMRYTAGSDFTPDCAPMVRQVQIVNSLPFVIYVRFPIWAAVEAVVTKDGARAPAGVHLDVVRADTNAIVGGGNTDASGYLTATPIPANGSRAYKMQPGPTSGPRLTVALRPHDRVRMLGVLGGALRGVCNLETEIGQYCIAYGDSAAGIRFKRSDTCVPPFVVSSLVTTTPTDSEPCLAEWENDRILCGFTRAGLGVMESYSTDHGETWSDPVMAFSGGKHYKLRRGVEREMLRAAYMSGAIQGTLQHVGDLSPSSVFTFADTSGAALSVEDDTFDLESADEGPARWLLIVRILGETEPSNWYATDDGHRWLRI